MQKPSGRIGVAYFVVAPVGLALIGGCGVLYGLAAGCTPWGLTNPVAAIVLCVTVGYVSSQSARLGKLRNVKVACLFALAGVSAMAIASAMTMQAVTGHAGSVFEFLGQRRVNGVTMVGSWSLGGWLLVVCWVLLGLQMFFTASFGLLEAERPFCEKCETWAWKSRWKFRLVGPADGTTERLKHDGSLDSLTTTLGGGDPTRLLISSIGACKCGNRATLQVNFGKVDREGKDVVGDDVIKDVELYSGMAEEVFTWAEFLDPAMADHRFALNTADAADTDGEAAAALPYPEGEPVTKSRSFSAHIVIDCSEDNEFTTALRDHIHRSGSGIIPPALERARNDEDLAYIAEACSDWRGMPAWLEQWEERDPDSGVMRLIKGMHGVKWAWDARGGGWVPKKYELFQARLEEAEADLMEAAEARPEDATPWAWLVLSGNGRQISKPELFERFKEALARSQYHRLAHYWMLWALTPKWAGSEQKLREFARTASSRAPAGLGVHMVVPMMHLELAWDRARDSKNERAVVQEYLREASVQAELREANTRCFAPGAWKPDMSAPRVRSTFAYTLWQAGLRDEAREHLMHLTNTWPPFVPGIPFLKDTLRRARRECRA